jgi:hypothetical protein
VIDTSRSHCPSAAQPRSSALRITAPSVVEPVVRVQRSRGAARPVGRELAAVSAAPPAVARHAER